MKVMGVVKGQDHTVSPVSNWFAFFLFHINQLTIPQIQLFWNLTLKNQRSRSWVRSKLKVTWFTQYPADAPPFRFTSIGPTIPEICPIECLTLKKHIRNSKENLAKGQTDRVIPVYPPINFVEAGGIIRVTNRIPPKSNQVMTITRGL